MHVRLLTLCACAALLPGCAVFNEECSPLVADPDDVTGWLGGDVQITKAVVRTRASSIGQLVAEAYYHAFDSGAEKLRPDLGLENAGSIRSGGVCESRETLHKGPVKRKVLRDVLAFDDQVVVVGVTHRQLKNIFEHALASLSPEGATSPSGAFLQVYGAVVTADCKLAAESLRSDGTRDKEGERVKSITLKRRDGALTEIPLHPPSDTERVRVAVNSYLLEGGDDFVDLDQIDLNDPLVAYSSAGGFNFEIIARYFRDTYTESAPLPAQPEPLLLDLTDCE